MTPPSGLLITLAWMAPLPGLLLLFVRMVGGGLRPALRQGLQAIGWPLLAVGMAAMTAVYAWNSLATDDWVMLTYIAGFLGLCLVFVGIDRREDHRWAPHAHLAGLSLFFAAHLARYLLRGDEIPTWGWIGVGAVAAGVLYLLVARSRRQAAEHTGAQR